MTGSENSRATRRRFVGAVGTVGLSALAGCMGTEDLPIIGEPSVPDSYRTIGSVTTDAIEREVYATAADRDRRDTRHERLLSGRGVAAQVVPIDGDGEETRDENRKSHPFRFEATLRTSGKEEYRMLRDEPGVREDVGYIFTEATYAAVKTYVGGRVESEEGTISADEVAAYAADIRTLRLALRDTEGNRAIAEIPHVADGTGNDGQLGLRAIVERIAGGTAESRLKREFIYPAVKPTVQYRFGDTGTPNAIPLRTVERGVNCRQVEKTRSDRTNHSMPEPTLM